MTGATHRLGGLAIGMAMAETVIGKEPVIGVSLMAGAVLGSLLPDIDNYQSSISHKWRGLSVLVNLYQKIIRGLTTLLPISQKNKKYIRSIVGHRGFSHSLAMVVSTYLLLRLIGQLTGQWNGILSAMALGTAAGMLSHILLDVFAGGVPLFMPFSVKRVTLARVKTGGAVEWICRIMGTLIFILLFCNSLIEAGFLYL